MRHAIHAVALAVLSAACGKVTGPAQPDGGGGSESDGGQDGAAADPACAWSELVPGPFVNLNGPDSLESATLSSDGLLLYYTVFTEASDQADIYDAGRESLDQAFTGARPVTDLATPDEDEADVELASSGDELFFVRETSSDIWRAATLVPGGGQFADPEPTGLFGTSPSLSRDLLHLYFVDEEEQRVMRADRTAVGEPFGLPASVVGAAGGYFWIDISSDELHLLMSGGVGTPDDPMLAIASRASPDDSFGQPVAAGDVFIDGNGIGILDDASWNADDSEIVVAVDRGDETLGLYLSTCQPTGQASAATRSTE